MTLYAIAYKINPMSDKANKNRILEIRTRAPDQMGHALERFRARSGLSQAAVAKSAGIRQATVSSVEKGLGTTKLETVYSVCAALGLEIVLRPRRVAE